LKKVEAYRETEAMHM